MTSGRRYAHSVAGPCDSAHPSEVSSVTLHRVDPARKMRPMARREPSTVLAAMGRVCILAAIALCTAATFGQTPSPASPSVAPRGPVLDGEVQGARTAGGTISVRVDATVPGGWDRLHLVEIALLVRGEETDRITYDIEDAKGTLAGFSVVAGTGSEASGRYLRIAGSRIVLTTGGANLSFRVDADVISAIPASSSFELSVTGDRGERAVVRRTLRRPPTDSGLTWGSVVTAAVIALLAGGFVGNLFASHRRPPVRPSVYASIGRRLEAERERPPSR